MSYKRQELLKPFVRTWLRDKILISATKKLGVNPGVSEE
jgi:hypothetical protein